MLYGLKKRVSLEHDNGVIGACLGSSLDEEKNGYVAGLMRCWTHARSH